jgi:hypothetical protein
MKDERLADKAWRARVGFDNIYTKPPWEKPLIARAKVQMVIKYGKA